MSLVAFAVRVALVRVLRRVLPGGFIVIDSPQDLVTALDANPNAALAVVFAGKSENRLEGLSFFSGDPRLDLEIQFVLPPTITFAFGGPSSQQTLTLDGHSGADGAFDMLWRIVARALTIRDDIWSEIFGGLVQKIDGIVATPYLIEIAKARMPAREVRLICDVIQEPAPGVEPAGIWADFLAAVQADPNSAADCVAPLAAWLAAEIAAPGGLSQGDVDRSFLGISQFAAGSVHITSSVVEPAGNPPLPDEEQSDTMSASVSDLTGGANG